jgi:hypothetical protein
VRFGVCTSSGVFVQMSDRNFSFSYFFVPKFGVSALHLKCTKHMGFIAMLFGEEYV